MLFTDESAGNISGIIGAPSALERNGVTLDKNRAELIKAFGIPTDEYWDYDGPSSCMIYHWSNYEVWFGMDGELNGGKEKGANYVNIMRLLTGDEAVQIIRDIVGSFYIVEVDSESETTYTIHVYIYKAQDEWGEKAYDSFMNTFNRVEVTPTQAMLNGREFEQLVSDVAFDRPVDCSHKWIEGATQIADIVKGNCTLEQGKVSKNITINNTDYLLYGVVDWVGSGIIYDVKYKENIGNYDVGNYYDGTQHRMYFAIVDGADSFEYLISNGRKVYREAYDRNEIRPIQQTISDFERWLKCYNLWDTYVERWEAK
jgi:hypothetical protein